MTAAAVSAAVVVTAFGPGTAALAAEIELGPVGDASASAGRSSLRSLPSAAVPMLSPALTPSAPALSAPASWAAAAGAVGGGHDRPAVVAAAPILVPAPETTVAPAPAGAAPAVATPAAAEGPLERLSGWLHGVAVVAADAVPSAAPSLDGRGTAAAAKEAADAAFRRLTGEAARPAAADASDLDEAGAPAEAAGAAAPGLTLPRSWDRLPAALREADAASLLAEKAAAQERARRAAPDARLVGVAINLDDPRARWIFTFRSDASRRELTVRTKRLDSRALGFGAAKAPTLPDSRLGAMGPLDRAYAALKAEAPQFRAARVEVDPAWNGPASYRFLDASGREAFVAADGSVRRPQALPLSSGGRMPPSFGRLPDDARGADGRSLLELKIAAARRARRLAPDARLVRAAMGLDDPRARWVFVFRSDSRREELTVWSRRVSVRRLSPREPKAPTLWDSRLSEAASFADAYAALKAAKPGLSPLRVELVPAWKGAASWTFFDARGRGTAVEAVKRAPAPAPQEGASDSRAPPASEAAAESPAQSPVAPIANPAPVAEEAPLAEPPSSEPPAAEPPAEIPPAPPAEAAPAGAASPSAPAKYLIEDFLGFRSVRGIVRDAALGRLPADASTPRIIDQIAGQFGIARGEVLALARGFRLDDDSPRAAWLAVYDRLQKANRDHFKRLDSHKYSGFKSFRELANISYAPGWRGALQRAAEVHKQFLGFAVRFPYHLFDMFVFGYFRQAIAFEFFHSSQDFLGLSKEPDLAKKWLEASLRAQSRSGPRTIDALRADSRFRAVERWFLTPIARPLGTFLVRRLTLAVMSAVAMGLLGAFAPVLPLSFALTSIPLLGPALVWGLNGVPVVVAAVPFVGQFLAPVVAAAAGALAKDLVLGPLLNTLILSTLLTFPNSAREAVAKLQDRHPLVGLTSREWLSALGGTAVSRSFWASNMKSFLGLATVGAEIEGIMTYAGQIDAGIDPGFQAVLGHKVGLFHAIGSAIERPEGQSIIPFGGAITWGSSLLYKAQDLTGFHISDAVMGGVLTVKSGLGFEDAAHAGQVRTSAAALVQAAQVRPDSKLPFDAGLWKDKPAEAAARIEKLAAGAGGLDAEEAAVNARMKTLQDKLAGIQAQQQSLQSQSRPITPAEQAEYDRLIKDLAAKSDEAYVQGKLSQRVDVAKGAKGLALTPRSADDLHRLQVLDAQFTQLLGAPPPDKDGTADEMAARDASYKALAARLDDYLNPQAVAGPPDQTLHGRLSPPQVQQIADLVKEIEDARAKVKGELAQRDATQQLLQAANRIRNHALSERRDGKGMLAFHSDFAKLDTVVDLALSLNEISAAEAAIAKMQGLLNQNTAAINAANTQNQQNLANTNATAAQQTQWQQQAQLAVSQDQASQKSLAGEQTEASTAVADIGSFQQTISGFLTQVNAQDKGQSATAAAEYARRLALLPQAAQWATTGNPTNPSAFSLSSFQADLAEVQSALTTAQTGMAKIATVPVEFAGALVVAVPGSAPGQPTPTVSNPTQAELLQILAQRKAGWTTELASKQSFLTQVNQMMDPNYAGTTTDVFGDVEPVSLPRWLSQTQLDLSAKQSTAKQLLAQLDATAAQLNAATGSNIPMLSGMSLTQLQTEIQNYGGQLEAVQFPNTGTVAVFQAKMSLISAAQNVPLAARAIVQWSYDQDVVTQIQSAMSTTLPTVQASLQGLVNMETAIIADIQSDVNFVNTGQGGGQTLINRKTALLQGTIIPALQNAQTMISGTLIPYQQSSIAGYASNSSGGYYTLYSADQTLLTQTNTLYNTTIPWAIVTQGAPTGNNAAALAGIASFKQTFTNYLNGYTDSTGPEEGIIQYQQDMKDRQCASGCTRTENLYGEVQPYSLPMKISQYTAEETQRAAQINAEDAQINQILTQIQTLSNGQYNLSAYMLPTGIGTDAGSVAKMNAIVNANLVPNLGTQLTNIAKAAQAAAGTTSISVGAGGSGTVPVGKQPSPTISNDQQIAILALNAAQRLVPSSIAQPAGAPAAYAIARYLYANSVATAAQTDLTTEVPQAVAFLNTAAQVLNAAVADCGIDVSYVNSNGTNATPAAVYARKVAIFNQLNTFLQQAVSFYVMKQGWDQGAFSTITSVNTYYNSLSTIYSNGSTVNQNEITEINTISAALQTTLTGLQQTQAKVLSWMAQLDPQQQSALSNVSNDVSHLQDQTRAVLDANINWHQLEDDLKRSQNIVQADLTQTDDKQRQLAALLNDPDVQGSLDPALVRRIDALRLGQSPDSWSIGGDGGATQAIVIKKSDFSSFTDALLGMLTQNSQNLSDQNVASLKQSLLSNPAGISAFIPGASIMQFGDNADGFYLVYQSNFSVPNGLNTGTWATLGNIAHVWGNNVSLNAYQFTSPPSSGGQNAPYGDKGVEVQVESLQGENWVNYLNVDLHRFGFDIPTDNSVGSTLSPSRLMIFDDYAVMLLNNKLYVGLAGYGDAAVNQPGQNEYYYGGNLKTSFKLTDVMTMDASQQALFVKDPRQFLEDVNLDFTGYDPNLNQDFAITASGDNKYYSRTQVGPTFDVNRLLNPDGGGDTFTVSLFAADTRGTDDIQQGTLGTTIVKGISIKNDQGKTWLQINNSVTAEYGQQANTLGDQLSFTLPDKGITLSAQGQIIGGASDYYAQISKKMSDNTSLALGYGSQYIGAGDRLSITMNTSFSLAQLWQAVADHSATELKGGQTLDQFNKNMAGFFGADVKNRSETVAALSQVYEQDVARKLISQDIGALTGDIQELRKAGAFMDNTRTRAMVGFTSGSVDNTTADLAVGGGPEVGTYTQMTLTKTQKKLIDDKAASLYREGLRLQDDLIDVTKQWQADVAALAEAQWDVKLANYEVQNAPNASVQADAKVLLAQANDRLNQALLKYNALTGRGLTSASPFAGLNASDLQQLMSNVRDLVAAPDRFKTILGGLDPSELKENLGKNPFNLMDWLPWVDRLTAGFGVQYQDMLNNQALTVGAGVRLPIYDPTSKAADKAYVIESQATNEEINQVYASRDVQRQSDEDSARAWQAAAAAAGPRGPQAAQALTDAIRAYRNGLIGVDGLRAAFDDWRWYAQTSLETSANASIAAAAAAIDEPAAPGAPALSEAPATVSSFDDAYALALGNSRSVAEVADRAQAAEDMALAQEHRIQKAWLDVNVGLGLTDSGLGWLPSIAITGIPVTPVLGFEFKPEELRELQVRQHDQQKAYYDDLVQTLKTGLAVQFYEEVVAYRAAHDARVAYDERLIPQLQAAAASGDADAARRLDEARVKRDAEFAAEGQALAQLNFLLGRAADAPLTVTMDPSQALASLQALVNNAHPVETQKRVLDARVSVARAVEEMVDKNLKVQTVQLEPVSIIVRSLMRLVGAVGDATIYDADKAAAARVNTLTEERARDAYDRQRQDQALRLRQRLTAAQNALAGLNPQSSAADAVTADELGGEILNLKAGLIALGEAADGSAPPSASAGAFPQSWAELQGRLRQSEQALAPQPSNAPPDIPTPDTEDVNSGAYARYDFAKQTLGEDPINKGYLEGWIEVRLRDPNTPPDVLLSLSRLRDEKAARIYKTQLSGAAVDADVLSAQFEADVRLQRWLAARPDAGTPAFAALSAQIAGRVNQEAERIAALLASGATPAQLIALVPRDAAQGENPSDLASGLIEDIRSREIDNVRATLFADGGLPDSFGTEDGLMQQINANTLSERMSYKGFTPVLATGLFQGTNVGGAFLEAPDPRDIQRGLESIMSDVLRKQMESDGRMKELSLQLNQLMTSVQDGERELEAQRGQIEADEADLRARTALANTPGGAEALANSSARLAQAWADFGRTMVATKSSFIELVSELQALGQSSTGTLRPLQPPDLPPAAASLRPDAQTALVDFWTERLADPEFQAASDAELAQLTPAVPAALLARLHADAQLYRTAIADAQTVRDNDYSDAERLDLLSRNDQEGKRETVRADVADVVKALGGLDPRTDAGRSLILFIRGQAMQAAGTGQAALDQRRAMMRGLDEAYMDAADLPPAAEASFRRLEALQATVDGLQDSLEADYLSNNGDHPADFLLTDQRLDAYLKAERNFDQELERTLESEPFQKDPSLARLLDGIYDLRADVLGPDSRAAQWARFGRGIGALDALIMLERSRLNGARWDGRPPEEIDLDAQSLQSLADMKARWEQSGQTDLGVVRAVAPVGPGNARTWTIKEWILPDQYQVWSDKKWIISDHGREFIDGSHLHDDQGAPMTGTTFELIGGVDLAAAAHDGAAQELTDNGRETALYAAMSGRDFLLTDDDPNTAPVPLTLQQVYGDGGLAPSGSLYYFAAPDPANPGAPQVALSALAAQSLPPEQVVVMAYRGSAPPPGRDAFPDLQTLRAASAPGDFMRLVVTPQGADKLADLRLKAEAADLRRGWVEVKLDSFGFARDSSGRVAQLYTTRDDFTAQWKAFDNADRGLAAAQKALADAQAAEKAAKDADAKAQAAYDASAQKLDAARPAPDSKSAQDLKNAAAAVMSAPEGANAAQNADFSRMLRTSQGTAGLSAAKGTVDPALVARAKAADALRQATATRVNAEKAVKDAQLTLDRSKSWTLYRSADLALSLDQKDEVVRAVAPAARGSLALDAAIPGGPADHALTGDVAAVVVGDDGEVLRSYSTDAQVDAAASGWALKSYTAASSDGEFNARTDDGVYTKVRFSHYEEGGHPVLLSERYLVSRVDEATSKLKTADHWAIMPYNWGNIVLEIPRGIVQAPLEVATGRNPELQHYLGRAAMYKSEGGETDHHGFFRSALGFLDVLDLLPDPVTPYFDPSQYPDTVRTSPVLPGQDLAVKSLVDPRNQRDVHLGVGSLTRDVRQASEDVDAARARTLARFNGGIEDVTIATLHGRGHKELGPDGKPLLDAQGYPIVDTGYIESSVKVQTGAPAVDQALNSDPELAAAANPDAAGGVQLTATPNGLLVDRVTRRVTVYPGASGDAARAAALDGYGGRVDALAATARGKTADDVKAEKDAQAAVDARAAARGDAVAQEDGLWSRWQKAAERIGTQQEIQRRIDAAAAEAAAVRGEMSAWKLYARELADARRGILPSAAPGALGAPGHPFGLSTFWAWALALFGLGALFSALWRLLRRASARAS
jgi:hypothetical protein